MFEHIMALELELMSTEPWLRGPLADTNAFIAPVLYSFQQAMEDMTQFTSGLSEEQTWARPTGLAPVGFQIRHIAGSVERLLCYALDKPLSDVELEALKHELDPGEPLASLLSSLDRSLKRAEIVIRNIDPRGLAEPRKVGRKGLPTTVIGLLVHIAEHTQRHVGQAIVTAKIVRAGG
jgi:hypothetical protein